jgi:Fe-S-cluster formation regulator IscX/YfhJ
VVTTDFLYLRLIGDRSIQEKDFGRIQIDRLVDMQKWVDNLKTVEDEHIKLAIMTANNHYAGFGPGTVNIFRNMLGLSEAKWEEKEEVGEAQKHIEQYPTSDPKQRTLTDFIN